MFRSRSTLFALLLISGLSASLLKPLPALAKVEVPTGLDREDRRETIRILGFASSGKVLSNPYPLGGYQGIEAGVSVENLPVEDLARLGNTLATPQKDVSYPKFSIGKGLYNNIDFFVHFIPYSEKTELSQYGGILRWTAYQAKFLPLNLSFLMNFNNANFSNVLMTRSIGLDVIGGMNVDTVAIFVGGGPLQSRGRFVGGTGGVTDSNQLESETVSGFHTVVGANVQFSRAFVTVQIDRYVTTVYSAKLGLRF
ncbi:MAG: hypothetical protein NDI61_08210 [Bdellovibrionaceae bacterium]|nr:hypothetical protein [Pseudobdellovibrionaceae bacterium]